MFHVTLRRICILFLFDEVLHKYQLDPFDLYCSSGQLCFWKFSAHLICPLLIDSVETFIGGSGSFLFLLAGLLALSYISWQSVVRYIFVKNCYIYIFVCVWNWRLYYYIDVPLYPWYFSCSEYGYFSFLLTNNSIILNISCHFLLACRDSAENSADKLMRIPVYVICWFFLLDFNIFCISVFIHVVTNGRIPILCLNNIHIHICSSLYNTFFIHLET